MKNILRLTCVLAMIALLPSHPVLAISGGLLAFAGLEIAPLPGCADATLILPILTGKVMAAFKSKVPELAFFSTDYGKNGSDFAPPVKFGQEVISQMAQVPDVVDYTPGDDLTTSSQNVKDLVSDVKVKMNKGRAVKLKLPAVDVNTLILMPAFQALIEETGQALGRDVVRTAIAQASEDNFSQEVSESSASDLVTLRKLKRKLNNQGALSPRFVLGNGEFIDSVMADEKVMSAFFFGQRTGDDPYQGLKNIEGFQEVREFPNMPNNDEDLAAFAFEKRAIHIAIHPPLDSIALARQLGIPVPILSNVETDPVTGLTFAAFMFIDMKQDIYAAFAVQFGVRGGRALSGSLTPGSEDPGTALDYAGVRYVNSTEVES